MSETRNIDSVLIGLHLLRDAGYKYVRSGGVSRFILVDCDRHEAPEQPPAWFDAAMKAHGWQRNGDGWLIEGE